MKTLLFSLTRDDFDWQYFCSGGSGGQNQNRRSSGVRCIHRDSGARAEARDSRDQLRNRRAAFERCVDTKEFKAWHKLEVARRLGQIVDIDAKVDRMMDDVRIEKYAG